MSTFPMQQHTVAAVNTDNFSNLVKIFEDQKSASSHQIG